MIGIIGGAGAIATSHLYTRVHEQMLRRENAQFDSDYPSLIITQLPITNGTADGYFEQEAATEHLLHSLSMMRECDSVIVNCNSLQPLVRSLQDDRMVDTIALVKGQIDPSRPVVTLASLFSTLNDLWGTPYVPPAVRPSVTNAIKQVIETGKVTLSPQLRAYLSSLEPETQLILGCTELTVAYEDIASITHAEVFDSVKIIADFIVQRHLSRKEIAA